MEPINKHQFKKTDQQLFTASFNVCWEILKRKEYYLCEHDTNIFSRLALNYGQDMYDAMKIIMNKIIKSNEHDVAVEKSKVESIQIVTTEATCDSGYDDNYDQSNQQQQKQVDRVNIDINNSQDEVISKKRKISVDEIHSNEIFKADNKKNNCDDPSYAQNIEIASLNENSIEKLHMTDFIEKEEESFTEESITIKEEMLPVTDDPIAVKMSNSNDHSIALEIKSNEMANYFESIFFKDDNQSYSNESIDPKRKTRIRTGSLAPIKYSFYSKEDDERSFPKDENYLDVDNGVDVDDNNDDNNLKQNEELENKIKVSDDISFEERARVVKLATENPNWSLDMLREQSGCKNIFKFQQVEAWKNQIEQGGSPREIMNCVNNWVLNKCIESQKKGEVLTNAKIQAFGLEAKKIFKPKSFSASGVWLMMFKKNHEITGKSYHLKINCNSQRKKSLTLSRVYVPYDIKVKVVNLANENRHWSLKKLREKSGCNNLENIGQLTNWKRAVRESRQKKATSLLTKKK
ncbi:uncharacterized protein LOC122851359 [Aphidius gifuensis]|uniref:uncharacterized protein LOC122851359 n=1 Tax=Aphidius gifuensis TaxID=684658 RepID=UPI001CDD5640|nr:uncharacterized protein LOC122851359 [Aphidius gifuensis]